MADATGALFGLDYPGPRARARLAELNWAFLGLRFVPLMDQPLPTAVHGRRYAAQLLARKPVDVAEAVGIAAYCAAAPLAQEVAQLLVDSGARPLPLVLFDADSCPADSVMRGYDSCLAQCGGREDRADVRERLRQAVTQDPEAFLATAHRRLARQVRRSLVEEDIDPTDIDILAAELLDSYATYLGYLVAAHRSSRPRWGGPVFHIMSRQYPDDRAWEGAPVRAFRLDIDAGSLLASPEAARVVAECLSPR